LTELHCFSRLLQNTPDLLIFTVVSSELIFKQKVRCCFWDQSHLATGYMLCYELDVDVLKSWNLSSSIMKKPPV
ncbi:hypothetical protein NDU88_006712, partial [Pleurodeles waltl]